MRSLFFRSGYKTDQDLAREARQKYKEFLTACSELRQRGYRVQMCFSHLDRSKDFRPEELIRIDVEISGTKHL
jgi:hypothetical protein